MLEILRHILQCQAQGMGKPGDSVRVLCLLSAARELWHVQVVLVVRSRRSLLACPVFEFERFQSLPQFGWMLPAVYCWNFKYSSKDGVDPP